MGLGLSFQLGPLRLQGADLRPGIGGLPVGSLQVFQSGGRFGFFLFQTGDQAVFLIGLAAVFPVPQAPLRLREGDVLLAGGNNGVNAPLQLRRAGHGHGALTHKGGALKHIPAHAGQDFTRTVRRQAGYRLLGACIDRLKLAQWGIALAGAA